MEKIKINQVVSQKSFHQVESVVEGITIFAPDADPIIGIVEKPITEYKCPQCGANISYNVSTNGLNCSHCGYVGQIDAEVVGKQAELSEFTVGTLQNDQQGWGVDRKILHCNRCGAEMSLPSRDITAVCPFCTSHEVLIGVGRKDFIRPRFLIPFKFLPENVRNRAKEWLGKGWFHPAELVSQAVVDKFTGLYLPFWTFSSGIQATWKAEVGYEHTSRYYDHHNRRWRTRVEIRWRWETGSLQLNIQDLLICGSTHISEVISHRIYPFNLADLVEFNPDYLAGWEAQAANIKLTDAWVSGKDKMREKAREACRADIHSSHVRNLSLNADFSDETWRNILLPIYIASYKYNQKIFQVMINGQTGAISGQKPVAWWKIWLAIAACLAPGAAIALIGLPLTLLGGFGVVLIMIGIVLLVIGGAASIGIYRKAVESESE